MAQLAVAAVGAAVGFAIGGPLGASIGWGLGSVAGAALFSRGPNQTGPRITEVRTTGSTYGAMLPIVYGAGRVGTQVIWAGQVYERENRSGSRKRGFVTNYTYEQSFAAAVCQGPVQAFRRVWMDNRLVYSAVHDDVVEALRAGAFGEIATFYYGTEDQGSDPTIEEEEDDAVPAYLGTAYIVFKLLDLTEWGNRIPAITVEVVEFGVWGVPHMINRFGMYADNAAWVPDEYQVWGTDWIEAPTNKPVYEYSAWTARRRDLLRDDDADDWVPPRGTGNVIDKVRGGWATAVYEDGRTNPVFMGHLFLISGPAGTDPEGRTVLPFQTPFMGGATAFYARPYTESCLNDPRIGMQIIAGYLAGLAEGYQIKMSLMIRQREDDSVGTIISHIGDAATNDLSSNMVRSGDAVFFIVKASAGSVRTLHRIDLARRDLYATLDRPEEPGGSLEVWQGSADVPDGSRTVALGSQDTGGDWIGVDEVTGDVYFRFAANDEIHRYTADLQPRRVDPNDDESAPVTYSLPLQPGSLRAMHVWNSQIVTTSSWNSDAGGNIFAQYRLADDGGVTLMGEVDVGDSGLGLGVDVGEDEHTPVFVPLENGVFLTNSTQWTMAPRLQGAGRTLAQVIEKLCEGRLESSEMQLAAVDGIVVRGYQIEQRTSRRQAIEPLLTAYACTARDSAGALELIPRGGASVATIAAADIGAARDLWDPNAPPWQATRERTEVLPVRVDVTYVNADDAYLPGNAIAQRGQALSEQQITVQFPVAMSPDEASPAAWRLLAEAWLGRTAREITLTLEYAAIEPGDTVTVGRDDGTTVRAFVAARSEDDGIITLRIVDEDDGVYLQTAAGAPAPDEPTIAQPHPATSPIVFEVPPLAEAHGDSAALYVAGQLPEQRTWPGAVVVSSRPDDGDMISHGDLPGTVIAGSAVTALRDFDPATQQQCDARAALTVALPGTPDEFTVAEQLEGGGLVLVGAELLRYREANQTADGWQLTNLIRGVRGSDAGATGHAAGDRVVLLPDVSLVAPVGRPASGLGVTRRWRTVTLGKPVPTAPSRIWTFGGGTGLPLAPVHLRMGANAAGDRVIKWTRRDRGAYAPFADGIDLPMSEASEVYYLQVLNASTGALVREATIEGARSWTYTAAMWDADWSGVLPQTLRIRVAQVSSTLGAGHWADKSLSDAISAVAVRVLHFDGTNGSTTIRDTQGFSYTCAGSAQISTAQSKFGGASLSTPGSSWVTGPTNDAYYLMGAGDFTIEGWVRASSTSGTPYLIAYTSSAGGADTAWRALINAGQINLTMRTTGNVSHGGDCGAISTNTWTHWAMCRRGSRFLRFVGGVGAVPVSVTGLTMQTPSGSGQILIGQYGGANYFNGYQDEIRVWPGYAAYTADFTPPAAPFD